MRKIQVESIVFRIKDGTVEYLLLKRTPQKGGFWQAPCGGFEETDSSLLSAALREISEETSIPKEEILKTHENVFKFTIDKHYLTGKPIPSITEHVFAFQVKENVEVSLDKNISLEHEEFKWVDFDSVINLLKWKNNKDALREVHKLVS